MLLVDDRRACWGEAGRVRARCAINVKESSAAAAVITR